MHFDAMTYFDVIFGPIFFYLFPNGEEYLNTFGFPDPDHLRGELSHSYNPSCVNKSSQASNVL